MPTIYDNIEQKLLEGLKESLRVSHRGDFCVGYLNLRGWTGLADEVEQFEGGERKQARVLVGMNQKPEEELLELYANGAISEPDQKAVLAMKRKLAEELRNQLTLGLPSEADEKNLRRFAQQIRDKKVVVKLHLLHQLHAKLYLAFRDDRFNPIIGFVGSSNLTFSGLRGNGELNVDVVEGDAAKKLAKWFEDRWDARFCIDISEDLLKIIDESWAGAQRTPYELFLKIVYHLSNEARIGLQTYEVPPAFKDKLLKFQAEAVRMAARMLDKRGGVLIGDVVGLGKTFTAAALIKLVQETEYRGSLVICPPNLIPMWKSFKKEFELHTEILSLGEVDFKKLDELPRAKLLVLDESHNLRNPEGKRYKAIREYVHKNESRVVLLSATPYNKSYFDLSAQLGLFLDPEDDLGLRPNKYIEDLGGEHVFRAEHQTEPQTLRAFEHSPFSDDWRDLMKHYMVRRTRSFIKKHSPIDETSGKPYLEFQDGSRFSFPDRVPKAFFYGFNPKDPKDPYAKLYSTKVVNTIRQLHLARYGLRQYIDPVEEQKATEKEYRIIDDLSRAGRRMVGFARTSLFKRLESSGYAFLLSLQRHILRNHLFVHALDKGLDLPIGIQDGEFIDQLFEDEDPEWLAGLNLDAHGERYAEHAATLYAALDVPRFRKRFKWLRSDLFNKDLRKHLLEDVANLHGVWSLGKDWKPEQDKQLMALLKFCTKEHPDKKVLIFTQFADTAYYLHKELDARGVDRIAVVTGNEKDPTELAQRFSPRSNKCPQFTGNERELRVLVATDVLSEGQNLQDGHIIINYDLPWALIRLIQRAGRVDRIGQASDKVYCYSFLPEDGLENIINLRGRLRQRITENAEVVGTDEVFFDGDPVSLHDLYAEKEGLYDNDDDDDVDLGSWAYQIWNDAITQDPSLAKRIPAMPNVVYSTRALPEHEAKSPPGVAVFVRTAQENEMLAWVNAKGELYTQSQFRILKTLECGPDTPTADRIADHHQLVKSGLGHIQESENRIGGQLGKKNGARWIVYHKLIAYHERTKGQLFATENLKKAIESIHQYPFRERSKELLNRRLREGIKDDELAELVTALYEDDALVNRPDEAHEHQFRQPHIICSIGLRSPAPNA
jgi:superfamily II DNA or RNA helicase